MIYKSPTLGSLFKRRRSGVSLFLAPCVFVLKQIQLTAQTRKRGKENAQPRIFSPSPIRFQILVHKGGNIYSEPKMQPLSPLLFPDVF